MAVPSSQIEDLITGYSADHLQHGYNGIAHHIMYYYAGVEGTKLSNNATVNDSNNSIAVEAQSQQTPPKLTDIPNVINYFTISRPTLKQFCVKMKDEYNVSVGKAKKDYKYLKTIYQNVEGVFTPGMYSFVGVKL